MEMLGGNAHDDRLTARNVGKTVIAKRPCYRRMQSSVVLDQPKLNIPDSVAIRCNDPSRNIHAGNRWRKRQTNVESVIACFRRRSRQAHNREISESAIEGSVTVAASPVALERPCPECPARPNRVACRPFWIGPRVQRSVAGSAKPRE